MAHEPGLPPFVEKCSILGMPTSAMRSAPEVLVLELMRTVFFERESSNLNVNHVKPEEEFTDKEKFAILSFQGRQKKAGSKTPFYSPSYPVLARASWLRYKDPVTVNGFLFQGPIAHYYRVQKKYEEELGDFVDLLFDALLGDSERNNLNKDIYARIIESNDGVIDISKRKTILNDALIKYTENSQIINADNAFAKTSTLDFISLLRLEKHFPRHHWIALLTAYLRITMGMWQLYLCHSMITFRSLIDNALTGKNISQENIENKFNDEVFNPLCPSMVGSYAIDSILEDWMKSRIRISVILKELNEVELIKDESYTGILYLNRTAGSGKLSIYDLLAIISNDANTEKKYQKHCEQKTGSNGSNAIDAHIIRECEKYSGFKRPLKAGQAKNAREFLEMLRKSEGFDDRASHLIEKVPSIHDRRIKNYRVIPGQLLMQLFVFFSDIEVAANKNIKRGLVLRDVENHFKKYGIDFTSAPDGRKLLIESLDNAGLVMSSPDAGASMQITNPYKKVTKEINNPYNE